MHNENQETCMNTERDGNGELETTLKALESAPTVPVNSSPGTGRRVGIAAALVVIALVAIYVVGLITRHRAQASLTAAAQEAADLPPPVEVADVHRAAPKKILTLPGDARAFNETTIYARTSGYINKWLVDIGDGVKKGQTLATIDTPELDEQLNAARAKVLQSKSESALAVSAAKFAQVTYDRFQGGAPEGVVSEQERDEKKAALDTSNAKVAAADAQVTVDEAEVHRLESLVAFKNVTAPFDGTITQRHIDIGDLVTAGSTTSTTPLFSIARADQLRVFVDVPQSATPEVKDGMSAIVLAREFPDRQFKGTVDRMSESVNQTSRTMEVEVIVPNPDNALKPGDYVEVSFQTDRRNPPLEVPASALAMKPQGPEVAVVDADGKVSFHKIEIEQDMGSYIEVSSGLEDGQRVALNIGADVSDGDKIEVHAASNDAPSPAPKQTTAETAQHVAVAGSSLPQVVVH
jgi:RND family efflux transporter MFP subunit